MNINIDYPREDEENDALEDLLGLNDEEEESVSCFSSINFNPFMTTNFKVQAPVPMITHPCSQNYNPIPSQTYLFTQGGNNQPLYPQNSNYGPVAYHPHTPDARKNKSQGISLVSTAIPFPQNTLTSPQFQREKDQAIAKEFKFNHRMEDHNQISIVKVQNWIQNNFSMRLSRVKKKTIHKLYLYFKSFFDRSHTKKQILKNLAKLLQRNRISDRYLSSVLCINKLFISDKLNKRTLCAYFSKLVLLEMLISRNFRIKTLSFFENIETQEEAELALLLDYLRKL